MQKFYRPIQKSCKLGVAFAAASLLMACSSSLPFLSNAKQGNVYETTGTAASTGTQIVQPTGFAKWLGFITPYSVPIQQGNFISQEMVAQLKEGMTREQVRDLLGTPLLTDMFHEDRWDYPFRLVTQKGGSISSLVTVHFKSNTVAKFEGGNLPTEKDYIARISDAALGVNKVESLEGIEDQSKKKR